jgi:hypothetical protein
MRETLHRDWIALLLATLTFISGCARGERSASTKMARLTEAADAIAAATMQGVNYATFSNLVLEMGTQVLVAERTITTDCERRYWLAYAETLQAYRDSLVIWRDKSEHSYAYERGDHALEPAGEVLSIVAKYRIPREDVNWAGQTDAQMLRHLRDNGAGPFSLSDMAKLRQTQMMYRPDDAIQQIWAVAVTARNGASLTCAH